MRKLKILNLSTYDSGGAGMASVFANNMMMRNGHDARLMVLHKTQADSCAIEYQLPTGLRGKWKRRQIRHEDRRWQRQLDHAGFDRSIEFASPVTPVSAVDILLQCGFSPDIIILHWVSGFITPQIIRDLRRLTSARIIWIMMDDAPMTGGCHYPFNCKGYKNDCGDCPLFKKPCGFAAATLSDKLRYCPEDMELWATGGDCQRLLDSAIGQGRTIRRILFPIDTSQLSSNDTIHAKNRFGISPQKSVIMAGCSFWHERRKGGEYLIAALAMLKERRPDLAHQLTILLVGASDMPVIRSMGYDVTFTGRLSIRQLMEAYRASDVFVSSSIEDSGPLMVNQSIASGTPVACFDIGVAIDIVQDGRTGWKAPVGDAAALSVAIENTLVLMQHKSVECRNNCVSLYKILTTDISMLQRIEEISQQ